MSGAYGPNRWPPNRRPTSRRLDPAVYRRRRLGVALVALLIVAVLVGIISLIGGGGPSSQKSTSHTTTTLARLPRDRDRLQDRDLDRHQPECRAGR